VLSALAEALQVSADALLTRAAGAANGSTGPAPAATEDAIRHDPRLDDAQKRALLGVLTTYVGARTAPSTRSTTRTTRGKAGTPKSRATKGKP